MPKYTDEELAERIRKAIDADAKALEERIKSKARQKALDAEVKRLEKEYNKKAKGVEIPSKPTKKHLKKLLPITAPLPTKKELAGLTKKQQKNLIAARKLRVRTAKEQFIKYRDRKTGRFVKADKLDGKKAVKYEIWRSKKGKLEKGQKRFKLMKQSKAWIKRKKPLTPDQFLKELRAIYKKTKIRIEMIEGRIFAWTET